MSLQTLTMLFQHFFNLCIFCLCFFKILFCLFQITGSNVLFLGHIFHLRMNLIILHQKDIDIQITKLITIDQIFMCLLRLLFQWSYLLFQLRQNILNTDHILLLLRQVFLCSSLSLFELHNTGSLIKKLTSLLRLTTQDLIDLPLSDNGVALLTDTGIKQQLLNITKSAGCTV